MDHGLMGGRIIRVKACSMLSQCNLLITHMQSHARACVGGLAGIDCDVGNFSASSDV